MKPSLPDQAAFHEALADVVALLSVFSVKEVVDHALGPANEAGTIDAVASTPAALARKSVLFGLAEQIGDALGLEARGGLRRSAGLRPPVEWRTNPDWEPPHRRGEVLVGAILDTLVGLWTNRLKPLDHRGRINRDRAAEEGAKAADHLLRMVLRGIDYLPPVDFEFEDFLAAVELADREVAPDDHRDYRKTLRDSFARVGIELPPAGRVIDLAMEPTAPKYHGLNFVALRTDIDEVFRFIWENSSWLRIDLSYYTHVEAVRSTVRVGPDGLVVSEAVADYIQMRELTAAEFIDEAGRWATADRKSVV